jgi:beta-1,4-mannosyltransferase
VRAAGAPARWAGVAHSYRRLEVTTTEETGAAKRPRQIRRAGIASFPAPIPENPYQRLLYEHLAPRGFSLEPSRRLRMAYLWSARKRVGFLHFHWPQPYYASPIGTGRVRLFLSWVRIVLLALRLWTARALGYTIAWTVHEVLPHELLSPRLDRTAARLIAANSNLIIAHDEATARAAWDVLGVARERVAIIPHGSFAAVYPQRAGRQEARTSLGIPDDAFVFLAFGHIRRYKDIPLLLEAFGDLDQDRVMLVIAGPVMDEDAAGAVRDQAASDRRVRVLLEFVPDDRVAELFALSDAAVITRRDGGTSGALVLALSFGLPVVVTGLHEYVQLAAGGAAAWTFEPGHADSLREALAAAASRADYEPKRAAAEKRMHALDWDEVAEATASALRGAARQE